MTSRADIQYSTITIFLGVCAGDSPCRDNGLILLADLPATSLRISQRNAHDILSGAGGRGDSTRSNCRQIGG